MEILIVCILAILGIMIGLKLFTVASLPGVVFILCWLTVLGIYCYLSSRNNCEIKQNQTHIIANEIKYDSSKFNCINGVLQTSTNKLVYDENTAEIVHCVIQKDNIR